MGIMKKKVLLAVFPLLLTGAAGYSLDFTVAGGIDYASYDPHNQGLVGNLFKPLMLPIAYAAFSGDFGTTFTYKVNYDYDPIWRNTFSGEAGYRFANIELGLGFFMGSGDFSLQAIDAGFSGKAGFLFPGIFFLNLFVGSSVGGSLNSPENATRELFGASGGFWLPHILITGEFSLKDYIEQVTEELKIQTGRSQYKISMTFFSKNVPWRLRIDAGAQTLTRKLNDAGTGGSEEETINLTIFGGGLHLQASKTFAWFFEGEIPMNLEDLSNFQMYYRASAGFTFSYPER
jgi:hypothetical protein